MSNFLDPHPSCGMVYVRKRKRVDSPRDFIAELPIGVIDAIMERLPVRDAARMSVLSRKCRTTWTSIQTLTFDSHFYSTLSKNQSVYRGHNYYPEKELQFCRTVSKILFQHEGTLLRFRLDVPSFRSPLDITEWICYLSRKGVSEIAIEYEQQKDPIKMSLHKDPIKMSSHIFTCGNLEKLKLPHLVLNPPRSFLGFTKLTCLELDRPKFTGESLECFIKSCPLLTKLSLTNFTGTEHVVINIPNLSWLCVDGTFKSLDVRDAANLVTAGFRLQKWVELSRQARLEALLETLATSCNLKKLCFGGYFCKALYKNSLMQTPFQKLQDLKLSPIPLNDVDDYSSIIKTIQSCPAIERFSISVIRSKDASKDVKSEELYYNPDVVLANLRYAVVKIARGSRTELKLIEFLLNRSPSLEKLSLRLPVNITTPLESTTMNKLLNFHRMSPTAKVAISPIK